MKSLLRCIAVCGLFVTFVLGAHVELDYPMGDSPCIKVQMDVVMTLSNGTQEKKLSKPMVDESSTCTDNLGDLKLKWSDSKDKMDLLFSSGDEVQLNVLYIFSPAEHFPGANTSAESMDDSTNLKLSSDTMSYKCDSAQEINFSMDSYKLVMTVSKVMIQAFNVKNNTFNASEECSQDTMSTENPIPETTPQHTETTPHTKPSEHTVTTPHTKPSEHTETTAPQTTVGPPVDHKYEYKENDSACIILQAAIQLDIEYMDKMNKTEIAKVNAPEINKMTITGMCADNDTGSEFIMMQWMTGKSDFLIRLEFSTKKEEAMLNKIEVNATLAVDDFPSLSNDTMVMAEKTVPDIVSPKNTYFMCKTSMSAKMNNGVTLMFAKIKVQAFGVMDSKFSGQGKECSQDISTTENPTTEPPVTTPNPPVHPTNTYTVEDKDNNKTCVVFTAGMQFTIPYSTKTEMKMSTVSVPENFTATGSCNTTYSNITANELNIFFYKTWIMNLIFGEDAGASMAKSSMLGADAGTYSVKSISLKYTMDTERFPGYNGSASETKSVTSNITSPLFQSKMQGSYKCNADVTVEMGDVKLNTFNLQYKAFGTDNSTGFGGDLSECSADNSDNKTNSVVPIAVGAALAGLVVIVLIAYLIGRKRNRKGYESV